MMNFYYGEKGCIPYYGIHPITSVYKGTELVWSREEKIITIFGYSEYVTGVHITAYGNGIGYDQTYAFPESGELGVRCLSISIPTGYNQYYISARGYLDLDIAKYWRYHVDGKSTPEYPETIDDEGTLGWPEEIAFKESITFIEIFDTSWSDSLERTVKVLLNGIEGYIYDNTLRTLRISLDFDTDYNFIREEGDFIIDPNSTGKIEINLKENKEIDWNNIGKVDWVFKEGEYGYSLSYLYSLSKPITNKYLFPDKNYYDYQTYTSSGEAPTQVPISIQSIVPNESKTSLTYILY